MGKVIDIKKESNEITEEQKKKQEENIKELKHLAENSDLYKYIIRIISNVPMDCNTCDESALLDDYQEKTIKEKMHFESLGKVDGASVDFYYQLLQIGYRTFGANFFKMMCMNDINCINLFVGIWSLINGLEDLSHDNMDCMFKIKAYESLELTDEQKSKFDSMLSKLNENPLESMEKIQVEELKKNSDENIKK